MIQIRKVMNLIDFITEKIIKKISFVFGKSRQSRRVIVLFLDEIILITSFYFAFWLAGENIFILESYSWLISSLLILGPPLYLLTGQYKGLTKYAGSFSLYLILIRNGFLLFLTYIIGIFLNKATPDINNIILIWIILTGLSGTIRFAIRDILLRFQNVANNKKLNVAIFGAGSAGAQLAASLRFSREKQVLTFIDDSQKLWNRNINGIPIKKLDEVLDNNKHKIDEILLAIPSLTKQRRRTILSNLNKLGIPILQIPSIEDLTSGRAKIDNLIPIDIQDLLGRDIVNANIELIENAIQGKVICVSGAGGSIGSELCRQINALNPKKLILIENNELNLYTIQKDLIDSEKDAEQEKSNIIPILGSATDKNLITHVFTNYKIDIVFHAAAYKHVPIVESNPIAGIKNNVFSTKIICECAQDAKIKNVILISTDKAVRPSNIMGASKRLAELVVQSYSEDQEKLYLQNNLYKKTCYSIVRFGNVLGSSGSVVPLFQQQIEKGGPITLTHDDVIRYFMTIPEAAELVLQTTELAEGGDVFLLDMGEPVKIRSIAEQMIKLSGLTLKNDHNEEGDIEIVTTGLRPGEKLYEELLIDGKSEKTINPLIYRASEKYIPSNILNPLLKKLADSLNRKDKKLSLELLSKLVPEWKVNNR